jgi:hypothetical protein
MFINVFKLDKLQRTTSSYCSKEQSFKKLVNQPDLPAVAQRAMADAVVKVGAGGRTRTDTMLPSRDFESRASADFATPAHFI